MRIYKGKYLGSVEEILLSLEKVDQNIANEKLLNIIHNEGYTWESLDNDSTEGILIDIDYKGKYALIGLNKVREKLIINLRDEILKNLIDGGN